jgi:hypothetical protein
MWPRIRGAQINIPIQISIDHQQQQSESRLITNNQFIIHSDWLPQKA